MEQKKNTTQWLKSCLKKRRFREAEQVKEAIQRLESKTDLNWRYYYCTYCCGYHLTTKPEFKDFQKIKEKIKKKQNKIILI